MCRKYLGNICVTQLSAPSDKFVGNPRKSRANPWQQKYPSPRRWCNMSSTPVKRPPTPPLIGTPNEMNHRLPTELHPTDAHGPGEETET